MIGQFLAARAYRAYHEPGSKELANAEDAAGGVVERAIVLKSRAFRGDVRARVRVCAGGTKQGRSLRVGIAPFFPSFLLSFLSQPPPGERKSRASA